MKQGELFAEPTTIVCGGCGTTIVIEDAACLLAEPGCLWCPRCFEEVDSATGRVVATADDDRMVSD